MNKAVRFREEHIGEAKIWLYEITYEGQTHRIQFDDGGNKSSGVEGTLYVKTVFEGETDDDGAIRIDARGVINYIVVRPYPRPYELSSKWSGQEVLVKTDRYEGSALCVHPRCFVFTLGKKMLLDDDRILGLRQTGKGR
jgi:hypothetical protein